MIPRLICLLLLASLAAAPETVVKGRRSVVLDGKAAQLVIDIGGGSIVDFHFKDQPLNPLTWDPEGEKPGLRPMGHFLCLDRWGQPSAAEEKNGMFFHGEATRVEWKVSRDAVAEPNFVRAEMAAMLPMAGIEVQRRVRLSQNTAFFAVTETVTNINKLGRVLNMVQHSTIAPPFLDENTVVDSNARRGFMQSSPLPNPEEPSVYWPQALKDGQPVNLRHLTNDPDPNVVSFVIDENFGWATAVNAAQGLLIGYIWKTSDYPWFNAWRDVKNGKPNARGLEFGTTGLHQPFGVLVSKGRIFGRPIYAYLDAGQNMTKSYASFLVKVPRDFLGVQRITYESGRLLIEERSGTAARQIAMQVGELFSE
jgi:hypothetical protein